MEFELSPEEMMPETAKYTLRALVLQGSDIPVFKFPNAQVLRNAFYCNSDCVTKHRKTSHFAPILPQNTFRARKERKGRRRYLTFEANKTLHKKIQQERKAG